MDTVVNQQRQAQGRSTAEPQVDPAVHKLTSHHHSSTRTRLFTAIPCDDRPSLHLTVRPESGSQPFLCGNEHVDIIRPCQAQAVSTPILKTQSIYNIQTPMTNHIPIQMQVGDIGHLAASYTTVFTVCCYTCLLVCLSFIQTTP